LQVEQPERKVVFELQEGLVVDADAKLVRILVENLLGNAWKFTAKTREPRVEFGVQAGGEGPVAEPAVFFVRDNGVGFNMEYAGKLFTPFQRLHSETDFPGLGIGLAVARRIVQRHGGRIGIEAQVDRGATVYFTLPPAAGAQR
jgi:signal transduction histidine kinase